jgi:hypothetical protein
MVLRVQALRARFRTFSYTWPCDPRTPQHNTIDETTCRWRWCIGSRCAGRVLGPLEAKAPNRLARIPLSLVHQ